MINVKTFCFYVIFAEFNVSEDPRITTSHFKFTLRWKCPPLLQPADRFNSWPSGAITLRTSEAFLRRGQDHRKKHWVTVDRRDAGVEGQLGGRAPAHGQRRGSTGRGRRPARWEKADGTCDQFRLEHVPWLFDFGFVCILFIIQNVQKQNRKV